LRQNFTFNSEVETVPFIDFSIEHHLIIDETTASQVAQLMKQLINSYHLDKKKLATQDLSIEQVADTLDINYQSANNLLHRALLCIRKEWQANILILLILFTISL
jgi:DNA-directed RNA polymerase specialized sigma24 family protein